MNRKLAISGAVTAVVLIVFVVVAVTTMSADDTAAPTGADKAAAATRDLTQDAMGVSSLSKLPVAAPNDAGAYAEGTVSGNTRSFKLRAIPIRAPYRDGQSVAAWGFNGKVPGPVLHAREGERVRVEFVNDLPKPTTVHWHGVDVPWTQDGVPGVTQEAIEPGKSFTYEFEARPAGTRWYHTHGTGPADEASQLDMGLSGALVIEPRVARPVAVDRTLVLDDWLIESGGINAAGMSAGHAAHNSDYNVFTINGRAAPDVPDLIVKRGQTVRLRFVNASSRSYHPMHLHGHQGRVVARDGNPVPAPELRNVVDLAPGETADVEFTANNPGVWMLHCHDLHHSGAGMHMLVRYPGFEPVVDHDGESDH